MALKDDIVLSLVYLMALAVFRVQTGLLAMALYSLSGASINVRQLALPVTPGTTFIALALYCIVKSAPVEEKNERRCLLAARPLFFVVRSL
jgi:4-amino-4-deoxy-L-arabinose transferase-like glycosyltransferase